LSFLKERVGNKMDAKMQEKVSSIVKKIQSDPKLLKEFETSPAKAIEKVADIDIPDFLEPQIEKVAKEAIAKGVDPMDIVKKFIK
jgi:hypothetical protein